MSCNSSALEMARNNWYGRVNERLESVSSLYDFPMTLIVLRSWMVSVILR